MDGLYSHGKWAEEILNYLNQGMKGVNTMFDQEKMAQTISGLAKDYTTANIQVMKTTMEQWEKTMNTLIKQGTGVQDEGTKLWADWFNRAKQGQQQYANMMEEGLKKMDNIFNNTDGQKRATK